MLRTLKFTRYLAEFGWNPAVVTVDPKHYDTCDERLNQQIPSDVQVVRTPAINTKKAFSIKGRYLKACAIPDRFIGWLPYAVSAGRKLIREWEPNAIYSTSPIATSHMVAWTLKRMTGLPWVADFRDPWTEPELEQNPRAPLFRLESHLERQVLKVADRLIFTTAPLRDYVLAHANTDLADKAVVIPNGYDEDDFAELPRILPERSPVLLTHTGLVDENYRSPVPLLRCIASLCDVGHVRRDGIRIQFVGGGAYVRSEAFRKLVSELALDEVVIVRDRVKYTESLELQLRSHVLVLLQCGDDTRTLIPAKAFEYLRVGRPVLALVPDSATSALLNETGGATVVDPADEGAIRTALLALIARAQAGNWSSTVNTAALQRYRRRELTLRLADVLSEASGLGRTEDREWALPAIAARH